MKLTDKCWVLGRNHGVVQSTVSDCLRGDSPHEELFLTEADAWAAEAVRAGKEAERHEYDACSWRTREREAAEKSKAAHANKHAGIQE
jgi:hypothetical protein